MFGISYFIITIFWIFSSAKFNFVAFIINTSIFILLSLYNNKKTKLWYSLSSFTILFLIYYWAFVINYSVFNKVPKLLQIGTVSKEFSNIAPFIFGNLWILFLCIILNVAGIYLINKYLENYKKILLDYIRTYFKKIMIINISIIFFFGILVQTIFSFGEIRSYLLYGYYSNYISENVGFMFSNFYELLGKFTKSGTNWTKLNYEYNHNPDYEIQDKSGDVYILTLEMYDQVVHDYDHMPFLKSIKDDYVSLTNLVQGVFDPGRTCHSEYMYITGTYPMAQAGLNSWSDNTCHRVSSKPHTDTIATLLKDDYHTTYIHAEDGANYNRDSLMKNLGYDDLHFDLTNFDHNDKYLGFDRGLWQLIEDNGYQNNNKKDYVHVLTYEMHQSYIHGDISNYKKKPGYNYDLNDNFDKWLISSYTTDHNIELFFNGLNDNDTVIIIPDHPAYQFSEQIDANRGTDGVFFGEAYIYNMELKNKANINSLTSAVDLYPLVKNLFGYSEKEFLYGINPFDLNKTNKFTYGSEGEVYLLDNGVRKVITPNDLSNYIPDVSEKNLFDFISVNNDRLYSL